jgi:hypothetical protein
MRRWSALLLIVLLAACSDETHVASAKSPNGRLKAILTGTNGGATTSFGYEVDLETIPRWGRTVRVASLYGAARSQQAYGVNLVWLDDQTLEIQYLTAKTAEVERDSIC